MFYLLLIECQKLYDLQQIIKEEALISTVISMDVPLRDGQDGSTLEALVTVFSPYCFSKQIKTI